MEFFNDSSRAFVKDELTVQYNVIKEDVNNDKYTDFYPNYCTIIYNIDGVCKIIADNETIDLHSGEIFLAKKGTMVKTNRSAKGKSIFVRFLPGVFKDCEEEFLRVFYENKYFAFDINKFQRKLCIEAVHSLYYCILENRNLLEFILRLQVIISELNFVHDKINQRPHITKDNITVSVIEFIENHYTENITLKTLEDNFFISDKTINRMCKIMRGMTFHNYLTSLRLKEAENFMKDNNKSLEKIANLSGFQSYSSFFRAYKAKHGIAPVETKNPKQFYWPLDN